MLLSTGIKSTEEKPVRQFNLIIDFEGFRLDHFGLYSIRCNFLEIFWIKSIHIYISIKVKSIIQRKC